MFMLDLTGFLLDVQEAGFSFEADCVSRWAIDSDKTLLARRLTGEHGSVIRLRFFNPDGDLKAEAHIPCMERSCSVGNFAVFRCEPGYVFIEQIMQCMTNQLYNWLCIEIDRKVLCN